MKVNLKRMKLLNPSINQILFSVKMLFAKNVYNFSLIRKIIKLRLENKLFLFSGIKKKPIKGKLVVLKNFKNWHIENQFKKLKKEIKKK